MIMIIKIRTEHQGCVNIRTVKFDIADGIGICSLRICGLFGIAETFCILIDYGVIRKMTAKLFDICRINGIRLCGIAQYICRLKLNGIELNIAARYVLFCVPKENQKGRRCPQGMKAPVGLLSRRPVCKANAACSARQGLRYFRGAGGTN